MLSIGRSRTPCADLCHPGVYRELGKLPAENQWRKCCQKPIVEALRRQTCISACIHRNRGSRKTVAVKQLVVEGFIPVRDHMNVSLAEIAYQMDHGALVALNPLVDLVLRILPLMWPDVEIIVGAVSLLYDLLWR